LAAIAENRSELDLSGRELTELPPEIGLASGLEALDVSGNRLTSLPPSVGLLTNLKELAVSENRLMALPLEIGLMRNLENLVADHNELRGIPRSIGHLGKLRRLDLRHNRLAGLPLEIEWLGSLRELLLSDNQLTVLPVEVGKLVQLRHLWVERNKLTALPPEISQLAQLKDWDFARERSLPPRFPWALAIQENPLQDPPADIRGTEKVQAYLREKLERRNVRAERRKVELRWATTTAEWENIIQSIVDLKEGTVWEFVAGGGTTAAVVELDSRRVTVCLDDLGITWLEWTGEPSEGIRTLVARLSHGPESTNSGMSSEPWMK
jgi:Leucine-rich repeat (LRR) protein